MNRVAFLCRRPLDGMDLADCLLEHGCGALNISDCRVPYSGDADLARTLAKNPGRTGGVTSTVYGANRPQQTVNLDGRWPPNVVLIGGEFPKDWSHYFIRFNGGDVSGLPADLEEYLLRLITSASAEILVLREHRDLSETPDGHYGGALVFVEPGEELARELLRVVLPGAYVLLVAPEERPTGYVGACTLEETGFEIRDAILVAEDAERVHYVPKANTREREQGCETLAQRRVSESVMELLPRIKNDPSELESVCALLLESGVSAGEVDAVLEQGLRGSRVPAALRDLFRVRPGFTRKGNLHPTVKPVKLMQRLLVGIGKSARVLDPFSGSGTTGIACMRSDLDFIGIEREAEYAEITACRWRSWASGSPGPVTLEGLPDTGEYDPLEELIGGW